MEEIALVSFQQVHFKKFKCTCDSRTAPFVAVSGLSTLNCEIDNFSSFSEPLDAMMNIHEI